MRGGNLVVSQRKALLIIAMVSAAIWALMVSLGALAGLF